MWLNNWTAVLHVMKHSSVRKGPPMYRILGHFSPRLNPFFQINFNTIFHLLQGLSYMLS